jgi:hypothetical protein
MKRQRFVMRIGATYQSDVSLYLINHDRSELRERARDLAVVLAYAPIRMRFGPLDNLDLRPNPDLALHQ